MADPSVVELSARAQVYLKIPVTGIPLDYSTPLKVSFDHGNTWVNAIWNTERTEARLLVAGPLKASPASGTVVLDFGQTDVDARLTDAAEDLVEQVAVVQIRRRSQETTATA